MKRCTSEDGSTINEDFLDEPTLRMLTSIVVNTMNALQDVNQIAYGAGWPYPEQQLEIFRELGIELPFD
jgi:hypothetical protein